MQPSDVVELMVPALSVVLVLAVLSTIASLVLGVLILTRGRTPSVLTGGATGVLVVGVSAVAWWHHTPVEGSAIDAAAGVIAAAIGGGLLVLLPAVFHLLLAALAGARSGPQRLWVPAVASVPLVIAVAAPVVGGLAVDQGQLLPFGILRSVAYAVVGALALPALMAGDPEEGGGPEASASAGLVVASVVGLGEAFARGAFWFLMLAPFFTLQPDLRVTLVEDMATRLYAPGATWAWIAVGAAGVFAAIGAVPALLEGGRRAVLNGLGLLWVGLAAVPVVVSTVPMGVWSAAAVEVPAPAADARAPGPTPIAPRQPPGEGVDKVPAP